MHNTNSKYKCCNLILHGLCFFDNVLVSCCYSPVDQVNNQHPPMLYQPYKGELLQKEDLFNRIKKYSSIFKNGEIPSECKNCFKIEEKEWNEEEYINSITITHYSVCNADCIYCSNNLSPEDRTNDVYEILPILRNLKEQRIIKQGLELHIGGGEFSIYKEADDLLKEFALTNFARVYIPTNAIKYSDFIYKGIDNGSTCIIVSLDCGTRKTFKKIKRIDAFNKVIENLKKYAKANKSEDAIALKYIIIPTVNDNKKEFKQFIKIVKKCGLKNISIDIDARYCRRRKEDYDKYFISLAKSFYKIAQKEKLHVELYSFISQCMHSSEKSKENLIKNIITILKLKFFDKDIKKLYSSHKY